MELVDYIYADRKRYFLNQRNNNLKERNIKFDIVQVGDSITEGFNLSRYIYINKSILNSGIGGDITDTMLLRFEEDVLLHDPKYIILMAGINDIRTFFRNQKHKYAVETKEELKENIKSNIIKMVNMSQESKVIWCKILPISEQEFNYYIINELIEWINKEIEEELKVYDNVLIIEYDKLKTLDGSLDLNMSLDGLHPNDEGYLQMALSLENFIDVK